VTNLGGHETVIFQHGAFSSKNGYWDGYREAVVEAGFRVIEQDALGHGESEMSTDPAMYTREKRGRDVAAILEAEDIEKVHYVGYSMGGFIATGFAEFCADRILSLTIGGWPIVPTEKHLEVFTEDYAAMLVTSVLTKPEHAIYRESEVNQAAVKAVWVQLKDVKGAKEAIAALVQSGTPVQLWLGKDDDGGDTYARGLEVAAEIGGLTVLEVEGDHATARINNQNAIEQVTKFLVANKK
jgi:pimeloyl-ACP methyl ester carboxylesterase